MVQIDCKNTVRIERNFDRYILKNILSFFIKDTSMLKYKHKNKKRNTSENGSRRNSSVFITSWKFSRANLWDLLWSSLQAWVSAKFLIPRQLVGWSWRMRNLQQASRTEVIWRIDEAGRRTWQNSWGFYLLLETGDLSALSTWTLSSHTESSPV